MFSYQSGHMAEIAVVVGTKDGKAGLTVSASGIGIPEADRERVFERFYRVILNIWKIRYKD